MWLHRSMSQICQNTYLMGLYTTCRQQEADHFKQVINVVGIGSNAAMKARQTTKESLDSAPMLPPIGNAVNAMVV